MGYKGQRKIMKRVNAPKQWYLGKLKGVYSTKPSAGPHKTRECIPLNVLLMQRLKYAMSRQESIKIVKDKEGLIKVDGKVRRDPRFPLGQMDVVTIEKTNEHFRILYDIKGRFQPHRIDAKEAGFKLSKSSKRKLASQKYHTSSLMMEEPLDTLIQISKSTIQLSTISRPTKSQVLLNSRPVPWPCLSEETTSVESERSALSKSIQDPSRSSTLRTPRVTLSLPESLTSSLSVTTKLPLFLFQREKVSDLPSSKREIKD
jgi:hypothetical protein